MGKGRHTQDRMFLSAKEMGLYEGYKHKAREEGMQKLPFSHCALSLVPFESPMLAPDGSVFDVAQIVPFVRKHHKNPVTGEPMETKDLVKLTFARNTDGQYCCPVTGETLYCKTTWEGLAGR